MTPRQTVAAEIERRFVDEITEEAGKFRFDRRLYSARQGAAEAQFNRHAHDIGRELGVEWRSAKQLAMAKADGERWRKLDDERITPFLDEARAMADNGEAKENIRALARTLADDAERAAEAERVETARRRRMATIDAVAEALAARLGAPLDGSNLSMSRYIESAGGKIRVSDHPLPPTYALTSGAAWIEINVGAEKPWDSDYDLSAELSAAEIAALVERIAARVAEAEADEDE